MNSDDLAEFPLDLENNLLSYQRASTLTNNNTTSPAERSESQKVASAHRISISNININVDDIHRSLNTVNNFATKRLEKLQPILIYEITADGDSVYKNMTLRELLYYVNNEADEIDEEYFEKAATIPPSPADSFLGSYLHSNQSHPHHPQHSQNHQQHHHSSEPSSSNPARRSSLNKLFGNMPEDQANPEGTEIHSHVAEIITNAHPFTAPETSPTSISSDQQPQLQSPHAIQQPAQEISDTESEAPPRKNHLTENRKEKPRRSSIRPAHVSGIQPNRSFVHASQLPIPPTLAPSLHANDPILDENGEEEIYEAVNILRLRDLRRLDTSSNPNEEKSILIRRHAVLFAMDPIRAVVMAKRIILVVPDGADSLISILDQYMKEWVDNHQRYLKQQEEFAAEDSNHPLANKLLHRAHSQHSMSEDMTRLRKNSKNDVHYIIPFEIHAYEALLMTVKALETQEYTFIHDKIQNALQYFKDAALVPIKVQSQIRQLKNDLSIMMNRVHGSRQALQYITEDDEEMALMNLSLLKKKPKLYRYPLVPEILSRHDEIEELIESYLMDFASLESKIEYVRAQIQSSEELVSLRLDTSRNELLIANTALAILSCSIAFGAYITGVFGMNLDNTVYIQPVNGGFAYIASGSFAIMWVIFAFIYGYLRFAGILPGKPISPQTNSHTKKRS